jgi:hypothetical protein
MREQVKKQIEMKADVFFPPSLNAAIAAWYSARQAYEDEPIKTNLDAYMKFTDELGLAIAAFQSARPALAEQLGRWFLSHPNVWSGEESESPSGL